MAATFSDVRNIDLSNSLIGVTDAQITCILQDTVPCYVNRAAHGTCADASEALVAAHLLSIRLRGATGAAGPVTAESAGGLSRSYAAPSVSGTAGFWSSTTFGQQYQQLASTRMTTPITLDQPLGVAT